MTDAVSSSTLVHPAIVLEDVCVNNLRHVDVQVQRGKLSVICGVSGSGKSSLAFDTLFAEGQRRYVETFSPYARQFLDQVERPNAGRILGIPPAIAIRQNARNQSTRSTVGTRTEILEHLKVFFREAGHLHCPDCDGLVVEMTADAAADRLIAAHPALRCMLVVDHGNVTAADWITDGFARAIAGGKICSLEQLADTAVESFDVITDRLRLDAVNQARIAESIETAYSVGHGAAVAMIESETGQTVDGRVWTTLPLTRGQGCSLCGLPIEVPPIGWDTSVPMRLSGRSLETVCSDEISELRGWLAEVVTSPEFEGTRSLQSTARQLMSRLTFLQDCGLGYLSLNRPLSTLSGGEAQRVVLTAVLGSGVTNSLYVLDEPTAGLHPSDTAKVIAATRRLQQSGNTVVVVEHDPDFIRAADEVIEIGPGAGDNGGTLVFQGTPDDLVRASSVTGEAIAATDKTASAQHKSDRRDPSAWLHFEDVSCHSIQTLSGRLPLNVICAITGVSGSGKSSLIVDALFPAICRYLDDSLEVASDATVGSVSGIDDITETQLLDQTPLPRSRRSIPATLVGVFDDIRKVLAQTHEAKKRNYTASMFSFNSAKGGRCPQCQGHGIVTIEMQFLADIQTTCELCAGRRFRADVLEVRYRDRSIDEILQMTAEDAFSFFHGQRRIQQRLNALRQAGLGYIRLGQPAATLSGGESQRLRIAALLAGVPLTDEFRATLRREKKSVAGRVLFILDEPTVGLHLADIDALMTCLNHLVEIGHSVFVIDHSQELLRHADYIVEMGPGAGRLGGRIISKGTTGEPKSS